MLHQVKRQKANTLSWISNGQRTSFIIVLIAVTVLWHNAVPLGEAKAAHSPKGSLKLFKASSSSLLHQSSYHSKSHYRRYKRDTSDAAYYDENYDVIPVMSGDSPPTFGDHLSEQAKKIAESFSQMWQSIANTVKNCVDAIRNIFSSEGDYIELTPEQEEQLRAAMEARGKAIEEQNEIFRNANENQI